MYHSVSILVATLLFCSAAKSETLPITQRLVDIAQQELRKQSADRQLIFTVGGRLEVHDPRLTDYDDEVCESFVATDSQSVLKRLLRSQDVKATLGDDWSVDVEWRDFFGHWQLEVCESIGVELDLLRPLYHHRFRIRPKSWATRDRKAIELLFASRWTP